MEATNKMMDSDKVEADQPPIPKAEERPLSKSEKEAARMAKAEAEAKVKAEVEAKAKAEAEAEAEAEAKAKGPVKLERAEVMELLYLQEQKRRIEAERRALDGDMMSAEAALTTLVKGLWEKYGIDMGSVLLDPKTGVITPKRPRNGVPTA